MIGYCAAIAGRVQAERTVGHLRITLRAVEYSAAIAGRCVTEERTVCHDRTAVVVVDTPAGSINKIAGEKAVGYSGTALPVI